MIALTKEIRTEVLRALKQGQITHQLLSQLTGQPTQKQYSILDIKTVSSKAQKEIEALPPNDTDFITIDKKLKIMLLNTLATGVINQEAFANYPISERPLFSNLNHEALSIETQKELSV